MEPLLSIRDFKVGFRKDNQPVYAVQGIDLDIYKGETLAIVGESGCGKSITAEAIMGLHHARMKDKQMMMEGSMNLQVEQEKNIELVGLSEKGFDRLRGNIMSMIFQEPMTALNPLLTIGDQVAEMYIKHKGLHKKEARKQAIRILEKVGIPEAEKRMKSYPFQLSGGQRQRVMIAIAMTCNPPLLIADEPTTALDVTIQSQILYLLKSIQKSQGTSIMFITHNLGIVAQFADRIAVMYRGVIVESGKVAEIFQSPKHPYTKMLLQSIPRKGQRSSDGHRLHAIKGTVPPLDMKIDGCPFSTRCPFVMEKCKTDMPQERKDETGHMYRCYLEEGAINE